MTAAAKKLSRPLPRGTAATGVTEGQDSQRELREIFICPLLENPVKETGKSIEATRFAGMCGFREKCMYMRIMGIGNHRTKPRCD